MTRQRTRKKETLPDPQRFNLESFAAVLPQREAIVGEDPVSWEAFYAGMRQSLNPGTPYEAVIAENLIAIEWELLQHRSMRDAVLRRAIRGAISKACANAGREAAAAESLADQAVSTNVAAQAAAYAEIRELGMEPIELMGEAYRGTLNAADDLSTSDPPEAPRSADPVRPDHSAEHHDAKIRELERRRREVKRDFDQLRQSRPDEGVIIDQ